MIWWECPNRLWIACDLWFLRFFLNLALNGSLLIDLMNVPSDSTNLIICCTERTSYVYVFLGPLWITCIVASFGFRQIKL